MGQLLLLVAGALAVGAIGFGIAALLSGGDPGLAPVEPDGRAVPLPGVRPLSESDVTSLRFDTGLRGYRMAQVDAALRRAAYDIGYKEELINVLEAEVSALRGGRVEDADTMRRAREDALRTSGAAGGPAEAAGSAPQVTGLRAEFAGSPVDLAVGGAADLAGGGVVLADGSAGGAPQAGSRPADLTGGPMDGPVDGGPADLVGGIEDGGPADLVGGPVDDGAADLAGGPVADGPAETAGVPAAADDRVADTAPAPHETSEAADKDQDKPADKDKPADDDAVEWGAELDDTWGRQGTKLG